MGRKKSLNRPIGGLDHDSEDRLIDAADYRNGLNLRNTINDSELAGTVTNVQGNLPVTTYYHPYNDNVTPTGTNIAIGSVEDTQDNSVIWFIWNSGGKHQILRHYKDLTDAGNPYGVVHSVTQFDFGWTQDTRITSASIVYGNVGDLLYWTDNVTLRTINLTKADVVGRAKAWNVFLPVTCQLPATVTFSFRNFAGVVIHATTVGLSDPTNRETIISDIAAYINGSNNVPVTAVFCDCHLYFIEKVPGTVWSIGSDCAQILIPAKLDGDGFWYGANLEGRFFARAKEQFMKPNLMVYKQDAKYEPNYVQKKVFQSCLQAEYDDDCGTDLALGVLSQIGINNLGCDGTSNPLYNYIDIDFNGQNIASELTLVVLKKICVLVRERNDGSKKRIIYLEPCEFLDYDYTNNVWRCHYDFYNDIVSTSIDIALAAKLTEEVPLQADSEVFAKNRFIEGGILEGYNAPACIDAKFQAEFGSQPNPTLHKITGRIRVLTYGLAKERTNSGATAGFDNYYNTDKKYPFWKPPFDPFMQPPTGIPGSPYSSPQLCRGGVFHDVTNQPFAFFGGGAYATTNNNSFGIRAGMESDYDQRIPEGGWPVYAAGTNYFSVSKQVSIGLPVDSVGAIDTSTNIQKTAIGNYYFNTNGVAFDLYNVFELNVPDGVYVIRLASHWCSFGAGGVDKLQKGFMYDLSAGTNFQKTSTNVHAVIDNAGNWLLDKEITVTVAGGDVYIGEFIVMDLAPPHDVDPVANNWQPISGYLYDSEGFTDVNSANFNGVSVEKTPVFYGYGYLWQSNGGGLFGAGTEVGVRYENCCTTDENGYFFGIGGTHCNPASPPTEDGGINNMQVFAVQTAGKIRTVDTSLAVGSLSDLFNKTMQTIDFNGNSVSYGNGTIFCVTTTNQVGSRASAQTVTGLVKDQNGNLVPEVSVVYQNGRVSFTAQNGSYSFIGWGDGVEANKIYFAVAGTSVYALGYNRDVDDLVFNGSVFCGITYPNGQLYNFTLFNGNPNHITVIPDFIINEGNNPSVKAHKRGGNYTYGIALYDSAGRFCSVAKAVEMYLPFITEDIGKYSIENFAGVVYPANTFKFGKPSLKLVLKAGTTFEQWVGSMQWVRSKNTIYTTSYLQWVANQVTYLSTVATSSTPEIQTSFQNADAVAIKVSISNITSYYAANNNSLIGYTYQAGDRLRLIANRQLVNYTGVNDFEITSYDTTTQSLIIKPNGFPTEIQSGTLFEIFNPKTVATDDEQIYYEVGEYIPVIGGVPQSYSTLLTNGDTYWHGRLIIVNDDATKFASAYPVVIESSSQSDFFSSTDQDTGRPRIIDPNFKQLYNPAKIRFSNEYNVETAKNGLSSFEELNQKDLPREYGAIKRMVFTFNNLVCIMENKEISNYIGLVTLMQASKGAESGLVSVTDDFLGTEYIHKQMLGTDFAGSVTLSNSGTIFSYNNKSANAWKYVQEETVISDVKMINFFNDLARVGIWDCISTYDRYHEEYILTVWKIREDVGQLVNANADRILFNSTAPATYTLNETVELTFINQNTGQPITLTGTVKLISGTTIAVDGVFGDIEITQFETVRIDARGEGMTIAWNETKQRWTSFYSFAPDCYGVLNTELYSYENGLIWVHGVNPLYNNFYGVQYKSNITVVPNTEPDSTKNWYAIYLEAEQDAGFNWSMPVVRNNNKQLSRILNGIFERKEEFYWAEFKRDLNTSGVVNPIVNGRQLRSSSIELQMENDYTVQFILRNVVCEYDNSQRG